MNDVLEIVERCLSFDDEPEWFEFKENWFDLDGIGQYISALSNAAVMAGEPFGYLVWGIHNKTHELTGTKLNYQKDVKNEPIVHYLARNISPAIYFTFDEDVIDGKRIVVLTIPAARIVPTEFSGTRYIRVGSSKESIKKHPEREAALFRVLNYGIPDLQNTPSRYKSLSFDQLFVYYETKGIRLKKDTFKENLELLTADGQFNMLAQLLSDDPHIDIQFALFNGETKASTMYAVRNFGHMCLLLSLDKVLDYGDTLNVPQADERNRKVERKEVMLFNQSAFREAVINAFVHNLWVNGDSPMFTSYSDRIEITSRGNLPPTQTKEGFFKGRSVPVNKKLSEIFVQLHISEKSGRGVPRIVKEYGKDAFDFSDNSIMVTIPFERIDSAEKSSRIPMSSSPIPLAEDTIPLAGSVIPLAEDTIPIAEKSDSSSSDTQKTGRIRSNDIEEVQNKILDFCSEAKGMREIADWLGYKDKKTVRKYIEPLLEMGRMARTIPDKPTSNYQKYITIEK